MYKIAICDDDQLFCNKLEEMVKQYGIVRQVNLEIEVYYDGVTLSNHIQSVGHYDIIFIDIEMDMMSGIELGKYIRGLKDELTKIIYVSAKQGYAMELFQVRPVDFMIKPVDSTQLYDSLDKSIELIGEQTQYHYYKIDQDTMKIPINKIVYFESESRVIHMHTIDGIIIDYNGKIEELAASVDPKYFWRIHKSYLINYMHVKRFRYKDLDMEDGNTVPISQTYRKTTNSQLKSIMGKGDHNV